MSHATANQPMIGFGQVRHKRLRPVVHAFAYAGYFLLLPMRSLQQNAVAAKTPLAVTSAPAPGPLMTNGRS